MPARAAFDIRPHLPPKSQLDLVKEYAASAAAKVKRDSELAAASRIGGVNDYTPYPKQLEFHTCKAPGRIFKAGNQVGKTYAGAADLVWAHLGTHPYHKTHNPPIVSWACSPALPSTSGATRNVGEKQAHTQLAMLQLMAPPGALKGGSWTTAYSPQEHILRWANGGITVFKGYDQGLLAFESSAIEKIWFDEEPDIKEIFTSCMMRLITKGGTWFMTVTPVLSLQGKGFIRDELWEKREKLAGKIAFIEATMHDAAHLTPEMIEQQTAGLSDEEKAVRITGSFATLTGRVITEYSPDKHDIPAYFPQEGDRIIFLIDPGYRNPTAGLWVAVTPEGVAKVFMEHYQRHLTPAQHMAVFHAQWQAIGRPPVVLSYMDPASWNPRGTDTGHRLPSAVYEYRQAAEEMGATWFQPIKANNKDTSCLQVKRAFSQMRLLICEHLKWTKWEIERLVYMQEAGGRRGREHNLPERPVDKDNHSVDLLRYLCNTGLFPLEEFVSEPYDPLKEYWAKARASMQPVGAKEEWLA